MKRAYKTMQKLLNETMQYSNLGFGRERELVFKKVSRKRSADADSGFWETPRKALRSASSAPAELGCAVAYVATPMKDGNVVGGPRVGGRLQDLAAKAAMARAQAVAFMQETVPRTGTDAEADVPDERNKSDSDWGLSDEEGQNL